MLGMGYFSSVAFISDDVSPRPWSVYGNMFWVLQYRYWTDIIFLSFSVLQNKTLSGVGMDSAELPFDVSTRYFSFSSIHIRFTLLTNTKLLPMTLENDCSNKTKDAKMNEKVYHRFDSCMCVIWSHPTTSCPHDKHVPVPRATAKSPPSRSSFITKRHMHSILLVSLN